MSMAPTYDNQDYVVGFRWAMGGYRAGDIVVARHTLYGQVIKRIKRIDKNGGVHLSGDNPLSASSECLGVVQQDALVGRVIWRIPARSCYAEGS